MAVSNTKARVLLLMCCLMCCCGALGRNAPTTTHHHSQKHHAHQPEQTKAQTKSTGGSVTSVPNQAVLQNAQAMAFVAHNMYAKTHGIEDKDQMSYSDCARKHPAANELQTTIAKAIAGKLGTTSSNVNFFDVDAKVTVALKSQFCHAAVVFVPAGSKHGLNLARPNDPVIVVAFRGSDTAAAALADLKAFSPVTQRFRGQDVEINRGFAQSLLDKAAATSCSTAAIKPQPSCAESILAHVDELIAQHKFTGTPQVLVTGHSLGAAEASLFALFADDKGSSKYSLYAYTYGQPMIGLAKGGGGNSFRDVYGPLNDRTFRVVHNADPVAVIASACQRDKSLDRPYEQVGTMVRVVSSICAKNIINTPDGESRPAGHCAERVTGSTAKCTIQPPSWKDACSLWVGQGSIGKVDKCYCSQDMGSEIATQLLSPSKDARSLWGNDGGDHSHFDYYTDIDSCQALESIGVAQALPLDSTCAKYTIDDVCKNVEMRTGSLHKAKAN